MSSNSKSLRILVLPVNGQGHLNACHGLCEELRDRGHEIIFLLDPDFKGRLKKYGFEEVLLPAPEKATPGDEKTFWQSFVEQNGSLFAEPPLAQLSNLLPLMFKALVEGQLASEASVQAAIDQLRPDLIIMDSYASTPPVVNSKRGIPWVWMFSASPQAMFLDPRLPPFYTGLPLADSSRWQEHQEAATKALAKLRSLVSEHSLASGGQPMPAGRLLHEYSPYLNLYMSPLELQYSREQLSSSVPSNVIGVDCFMRTVHDEHFSLPEQLASKPGKLVFFSMGSFGCTNLSMMTRLVGILAKSKHRFIISKGPLKYSLPGDNLWGQEYLPQLSILPLVDLVVTHGGNNSVTEAFYAGKPTLVMPLFCDQHDNAQRIAETGLGRRLNPFTCTEKELLNTIDELLANDELTKKMTKIGERIRGSMKTQRKTVADLIEQICSQHKPERKS